MLPCVNRTEILQISVQTSTGCPVGILGTAWGAVSTLEEVLIPCFLFQLEIYILFHLILLWTGSSVWCKYVRRVMLWSNSFQGFFVHCKWGWLSQRTNSGLWSRTIPNPESAGPFSLGGARCQWCYPAVIVLDPCVSSLHRYPHIAPASQTRADPVLTLTAAHCSDDSPHDIYQW